MKALSQTIRSLVAVDKLEQALETLRRHLGDQHTELANEMVAHQGTLTKSKRDSRRGLISSPEEDQIRTKIRYAILEMLPDINGMEKAIEPFTGTVFISYSHHDREIALKLKAALEGYGI